MINHAMFQRNGRAGYVLKPLALRTNDKQLLAKRTNHFLSITVSFTLIFSRTSIYIPFLSRRSFLRNNFLGPKTRWVARLSTSPSSIPSSRCQSTFPTGPIPHSSPIPLRKHTTRPRLAQPWRQPQLVQSRAERGLSRTTASTRCGSSRSACRSTS